MVDERKKIEFDGVKESSLEVERSRNELVGSGN